MDFYGFVQWCFSSGWAGLATIIVLCIVADLIVEVVRAITGTHECDCDDEDE